MAQVGYPGATESSALAAQKGLFAEATNNTTVSTTEPHSQFLLVKESELCVEVPFDDHTARVHVVDDTQPMAPLRVAEVFGSPLVPGRTIAVPPGAAFQLWTWHGCCIRLYGSERFRKMGAHMSTSSNVRAIAEYHALLHECRVACKHGLGGEGFVGNGIGPRVVVCGGKATGRHSVAKTLANYAARQPAGWVPLLLDLDPRNQTLSIPGSVSVAAWEYPATLAEGAIHNVSLSFFCGVLSPVASSVGEGDRDVVIQQGPACGADIHLSATYLEATINACNAAKHRLLTNSGNVIGWSGAIAVLPFVPGASHTGAQLVQRVIDVLNATHVLVVGDDSLCSAIASIYTTSTNYDQRNMPSVSTGVDLAQHTSIFAESVFLKSAKVGDKFVLDRLSAASGVVDTTFSPAVESLCREMRLSTYFHGVPKHFSLTPTRKKFPVNQIDVFQWRDIIQRYSDDALKSRHDNMHKHSLVSPPTAQISMKQVGIEPKHFPTAVEGRLVACFSGPTVQRVPVVCYGHAERASSSEIEVIFGGVVPSGERFVFVVSSYIWLGGS